MYVLHEARGRGYLGGDDHLRLLHAAAGPALTERHEEAAGAPFLTHVAVYLLVLAHAGADEPRIPSSSSRLGHSDAATMAARRSVVNVR
jgi:hypothetical protein